MQQCILELFTFLAASSNILSLELSVPALRRSKSSSLYSSRNETRTEYSWILWPSSFSKSWWSDLGMMPARGSCEMVSRDHTQGFHHWKPHTIGSLLRRESLWLYLEGVTHIFPRNGSIWASLSLHGVCLPSSCLSISTRTDNAPRGVDFPLKTVDTLHLRKHSAVVSL